MFFSSSASRGRVGFSLGQPKYSASVAERLTMLRVKSGFKSGLCICPPGDGAAADESRGPLGIGADDKTRTCTVSHWILSPTRLPFRHVRLYTRLLCQQTGLLPQSVGLLLKGFRVRSSYFGILTSPYGLLRLRLVPTLESQIETSVGAGWQRSPTGGYEVPHLSRAHA